MLAPQDAGPSSSWSSWPTATPASDAHLVALARAGDDDALAELLGRYRSSARAKVRSYVVVGADRDDVVQEGMIGRALRHPADPHRGQDLDPAQARPARRRRLLSPALASHVDEVLSDLETEVLRLHVEGRSYQQIAERLQRRVTSIDHALQRIKKLEGHLRSRREADAGRARPPG